MSVIVMKRRFDVAPSKDEILGLLVGEVGDKAKAKDALLNILAPMKDLLAVLAFSETLDVAAGQYAAMLKEQEATVAEIESLKTQTVGAKKSAVAATTKLDGLNAEITELEIKRDSVAAEVVTETEAKLRVNAAVEAEYDKLRKEMLAKVASNEKVARKNLDTILSNITASQAELDALVATETEVKVARKNLDTILSSIITSQSDLDALVEKKRLFIASLTG